MSVSLFGWLEVRDLAVSAREPEAWSGVLALNPLVGNERSLFPLLFQSYPATGPRALTYTLEPLPDLSREMRATIADERSSHEAPCFVAPLAALSALSLPDRRWPHLAIELWWRDAEGNHVLKSANHQLSRVPRAFWPAILDGADPVDLNQYRYRALHTHRTLDIPDSWRPVLATAVALSHTYGEHAARMVGFLA